MKIKKHILKCNNCGHSTQLSPSILKEKEFNNISDNTLIATYTECPVCGEMTLKQLDNSYTLKIKHTVVKLTIMKQKGKKLSDKQRLRLFKLNKELDNRRKILNSLYWDEVYQLLNS